MAEIITGETICVPSEDLVAREIEGELIIVPLVSGIGDADDELYTINDSGKAIWYKLDGKHSLNQVAADLKNEFLSSADDIEVDVLGFVKEMVSMGILTIKSPEV